MNEVHDSARRGFAEDGARYGRGRPEYPPQLDGWLKSALALGPGRRVADVGAGTGKFCKLLLATGAEVSAVEPMEAMRAEARKLQGLKVLEGTAQHLPLAGESQHAIVCAQAFHWFARVEVLDEFARVLAPGGALGLVWNVRDESVDWVARITAMVTPLEGDTPRFYKGDWKKPFPHPRFGPLEETALPWQHEGSPEQVIVERFMSVSFIAALPLAERGKFEAGLRELIATHPELRGRERVSFPYRTLAYRCLRRD